MKINYMMFVFAILIAGLMAYGFFLLPSIQSTPLSLNITLGVNVFLNLSLCLTLGLSLSTKNHRSTFLIRAVGFSGLILSIIAFTLLKISLSSPGFIIMASGLLFVLLLLTAVAINKSKV